MKSFMSFLAGAFCGAVVGSVTALLLTPASGRELQSDVRQRFEALVEQARAAAETRRAQLQAQLEALKAPRAARQSGD
jgi:gas vesicle protein